MSKVYITASIEMDTFMLERDLETIVKHEIKKGPQITGDKKNADIFVNKLSGANFTGVVDCEGCPYEFSLKKEGDETNSTAPEGYTCPEQSYQTVVMVTINGELEGRTREQTLKEYRNFINYLRRKKNGCGFTILHKSCHIMSN